eukprot:GFUD01046099.1.p1 GENE.GFUD01046099.1~~GFUD01046099.1.p1  ORF type:complete len:226 (+),score=28.18 GFUD01046099.1:57-734(+)
MELRALEPPVSSPYSLPPASESVAAKRGPLVGGPPPPGPGGGPVPNAGMLRPSFPGGVPYPPRPGEAGHPSGGVRYAAVYPPGGQPGQPQPAQYTQRGDGQVFVRQPPADSRAAERGPAGARMTLRQAPYPIYQEYRDGVQVLGVGRGDQVHVVAPPTSLPGMHPHPQLGVGGVSHADVTSASKRPRMGPGESLAPLRIDTTSVKVIIKISVLAVFSAKRSKVSH